MSSYDEQLKTIEKIVSDQMSHYDFSHDFQHVQRVYALGMKIADAEHMNDPHDRFILQCSLLLHDYNDAKYSGSDEKQAKSIVDLLRNQIGFSDADVKRIVYAVSRISWHKGYDLSKDPMEVQILADADRLDAIGSIGIARCLAFSCSKGRKIYSTAKEPNAIAHFYEKLLLIKDKLNTETAKGLAQSRHNVLKTFVEEFEKEWNFAQI